MNVNEVAVILVIEGIAPDMLIELVAGKNLAAVNDHVVKEIEFFSCNFDLRVAMKKFSC